MLEVVRKRVQSGVSPIRKVKYRILLRHEFRYVKKHLDDIRAHFIFPNSDSPTVIIPVYNNPTYTTQIIEQLIHIGLSNIVLVNNASRSVPMCKLLEELRVSGIRVLSLPHNYGPHFFERHLISLDLPSKFTFLTDPDMALNREMPDNFFEIMVEVSERFKVGKVGFALDISASSSPIELVAYHAGRRHTVREWEQAYWNLPVQNDMGLEIYAAEVDTTFCLINSTYFEPARPRFGVRLAGAFTAEHLPWSHSRNLSDAEKRSYRSFATFTHWT